MSSEVEFRGKTVEQAVENACQQLDIIQEELKYDIVSRGATGIFRPIESIAAVVRDIRRGADKRVGNLAKDDEIGELAAVVIEGWETHARTGFTRVNLAELGLSELAPEHLEVEVPVTHLKVFGWYDNEMGYSTRLKDLAEYALGCSSLVQNHGDAYRP